MKYISEKYITRIKILDNVIVSLLAVIIFINIAKAYIFLQPKANTPLLYFWERGSVKRELQYGLIFLTDISFYMLGLAFLWLLCGLFVKIFLLFRQKFVFHKLLIQQVFYFTLFCVAFWTLVRSWDGVIP